LDVKLKEKTIAIEDREELLMRQRGKHGKRQKKTDRSGKNLKAQSRTTVREKWDFLWRDEYTFGKRLSLATFPSFLLTFTLLFFGPLDIFLSNERYFNAEYRSFLLPFLGLFLTAFILLSVIVALTRGHVYRFLLCLVFGISLCCYIQGNFLNLDLGALDGQSIQWHIYDNQAALGLVIWAVLILAVFAAAYFFERFAKDALRFLCFLLVVMQGAALVAGMVTSENKVSYYLSGEEEYTLSTTDNVVVFVLDAFSNKYMKKILKKNTSALDGFHDFVYYDNYGTGYVGTFPGELHTLTSWEYDFSMTYEENFEAAWSAERTASYFRALEDAGYENRFYSGLPKYICGNDMSRLGKYFSNVKSFSPGMISIGNVRQFTKLSLYRYAPQAMKSNFWMYSGDITFDQTDVDLPEYDHLFVSNLRAKGLTVQEGGGYITYYMLSGAHSPLTMDVNGNYVPEGTSSEEQAEGYLNALCEFFEEMKAYDIYDNATIIVTADHGDKRNTQGIFLIKNRGVHADAIQYNHAPVSQREFVSTIMASLGLPYDDYGPSVFDFKETDIRERTVFNWVYDDNFPSITGNPDVKGKYNVMHEFRYIGDDEMTKSIIRESIQNGTYVVHVLKDSFYG